MNEILRGRRSKMVAEPHELRLFPSIPSQEK